MTRRQGLQAPPIRRIRHALPRATRAPWTVVTLVLLLGIGCGLAIEQWPSQVPWSLFALLVVAAGVLLPPRHLVVAYSGLFLVMFLVGVHLEGDGAAIGSYLVTVLVMGCMLWFAQARSEHGLIGVNGESMLVDIRDRLRAQGELPVLPPSWSAEVALESAYGDGFAGDFVVASRSTDGATLEIVLVDVSGKGRSAATRSLLLSGALGGLLGAMSEHGFLRSANHHLLRLRWPEGFATAVHVAVDLVSGHFTIGYAGHPAAAHFSAGSGRWRMLDGGRGPLLGVLDDVDFPREEGVLRHGDALVLYSDGVIEARDRSLLEGTDRMLGRAEGFVTTGFEGLAQRLCDQAAAGHGDDRAVVTIWRR